MRWAHFLKTTLYISIFTSHHRNLNTEGQFTLNLPLQSNTKLITEGQFMSVELKGIPGNKRILHVPNSQFASGSFAIISTSRLCQKTLIEIEFSFSVPNFKYSNETSNLSRYFTHIKYRLI